MSYQFPTTTRPNFGQATIGGIQFSLLTSTGAKATETVAAAVGFLPGRSKQAGKKPSQSQYGRIKFASSDAVRFVVGSKGKYTINPIIADMFGVTPAKFDSAMASAMYDVLKLPYASPGGKVYNNNGKATSWKAIMEAQGETMDGKAIYMARGKNAGKVACELTRAVDTTNTITAPTGEGVETVLFCEVEGDESTAREVTATPEALALMVAQRTQIAEMLAGQVAPEAVAMRLV